MVAYKLKHIIKSLLALFVVFMLCVNTALASGGDINKDDLTSVEPSDFTESGKDGDETPSQDDTTIPDNTTIPAVDLDIGDLESPMTVGSSQIMSVAVIPTNATETDITYISLTPDIATVNALGRIRAVAPGTAQIKVQVGVVSQIVSVQVIGEKGTIEPQDIDFEPIGSEITVGESVNLNAMVLPTTVVEQTIVYSSSDENILSVNASGRVCAISLGTATIYMRAGNVERSITLTVVSEIVVSSIDVPDFKNKMKVNEQQTLSVTAYPTDAKDQKISYSSTNEAVASVSAGGVITANQKGDTVIVVKAGKAEKRLALSVYIATEKISVPATYVILQPGDIYQINGQVLPAAADQNISYYSTNSDIVSVSNTGLVTAKTIGRASVVLSNDDAMKSIMFIVNNGTRSTATGSTVNGEQVDTSGVSDAIANTISAAEDGEVVSVKGKDCSYVSTDILSTLYQKPKSLHIVFDDYIIKICGKDIRNAGNSFSTDITLSETPEGISFSAGKGANLPGTIEIELLGIDQSLQYLYLFNDSSGEYERLNTLSANSVEVNISGTYLLSAQKIHQQRLPLYVALAFGALIVTVAGVYIVTKKRYWFW